MNLALQYPFMNASKKIIEENSIEAISLFASNNEVRQLVVAMIQNAWETSPRAEHGFIAGENLLYAHAWLRIILAIINNNAATYRVGIATSKYYEKMMAKESSDAVRFIALDQGLNAEPGSFFNKWDYQVPFMQYLGVATRFKSPAWKLVNRPLQDGKVFLTKHELVRMMAELVNLNITSSMEIARNPSFKSLKAEFEGKFKEYLDSIVKFINQHAKVTVLMDDANLPIDNTCFPPCIVQINEKITRGQNLTHFERLFFVSFMVFTGMTEDAIAEYFKGQPDYKPELTAKQIKSIDGSGAQAKRYKPANCDKLNSISICFKSRDQICMNEKHPVRNPMIAYKRKLFIKSKEPPK